MKVDFPAIWKYMDAFNATCQVVRSLAVCCQKLSKNQIGIIDPVVRYLPYYKFTQIFMV